MTDSRQAAPERESSDALERLRALVRIPTVSDQDETKVAWHQFDRFRELLAELYPATHAALEREVIGGHSLLFRWRGRESGAPLVLMAHYDVVPASGEGWEHPPFAAELSGTRASRLLWGRGTLDDKGALVAIMEATESLIGRGFVPRRDIYLSFGHNEETLGTGAQAIVAELQRRDVRPVCVIDEGGAIVEGIFPGVREPIAVVGVSEKGIAQITLTVEQHGGHASTPPKTTATVRLARAITRLNRHPFPARLTATNLEMIRTLGAHASGALGAVFRNAGLFRPILVVALGRMTDETRAIVRTTTAVTQLSGSLAGNALAEEAQAVVNARIAVGSSVTETLEHIRRAIGDAEVRVRAEQASEPSPVSPTTGPEWAALGNALRATQPRAIPTPYIMLGASDGRHFAAISDTVYRFTPFEMSAEERGTLHARNERIHVDTWLTGIRFYDHLITAH